MSHRGSGSAAAWTDWVTNGDRWTITRVHSDGALDVSHMSAKRRATLPADYVRDHVLLGYATTVHGAQGITADASHVVATGDETRQLLYVALTRGRTANHVYLDVTTGADPHDVINPDSLRPPTAVEFLTRVLERDDTATSATSERTALRDPAVRLRQNAAEYLDALGVAAESLIGPTNLARMEQTVESMAPGLTDCPAWPALPSRLMTIGLDHSNPYAALQSAVQAQPLDSATDAAAVLAWRLQYEESRVPGPLPGLPPVPTQLAQHPDWGRYFVRRAELLARDADRCRAEAAAWTAETAPAWAARSAGSDRKLTGELAVWRAVNAVPDTDTRPTGPPRQDLPGWRSQRDLDQKVEREVFGATACHNFSARALADAIDPRLACDPHWPALARQLEIAHRDGHDVAGLTRRMTTRPLPDEQPAAAPLASRRCACHKPEQARGRSGRDGVNAEPAPRPPRSRRRTEASSTSSTGDRLCPRLRQQADTRRRNPAIAASRRASAEPTRRLRRESRHRTRRGTGSARRGSPASRRTR